MYNLVLVNFTAMSFYLKKGSYIKKLFLKNLFSFSLVKVFFLVLPIILSFYRKLLDLYRYCRLLLMQHFKVARKKSGNIVHALPFHHFFSPMIKFLENT